MAVTKPKAAKEMTISWQEDPLSTVLSSLPPPPPSLIRQQPRSSPPIPPINISTAILCRYYLYLILPVSVVIVILYHASASVCILPKLPSSSKNPHFLCCRVLSSGPPTAIIHNIYHNLCLPSVYLVFLHIRYISTRRHCIYIPVISANHFPHHCIISPVIVCVSLCQGGTLFQATARLRKPPYLLSHISYVSLLDVPRLHRFCLPISTSPLSLLYHIFDGAYINRNFCCFPCLI